MNFTKMHGIGNDYVYVDCTKRELKKPEEIARFVSDRHFGIGSDGLILIKRSEVADFYMDMYNADGSKGEMCGNGIRCVAKYVYDYGLTDKKELTIETLAGIKELVLTIEEDKVAKVRVNMGAPILAPEKIPVLASKEPVVKEPIVGDDKEWEMTCVSVGNPHAIVCLEEPVSTFPIEKVGPSFEHHKRFPNRINTEFVEVINRDRIKMRVWERGANETFACGTGACASVVAAILNGYCNKKVTVELLGGELEIEWKDADNGIYMTGSATTVFDGQITLPEGLE